MIPANAGFRMPAEWEPHRATWLVWPHHRGDWEVKTEAIPWCYAEIARHLIGGERVAILVGHAARERRARDVLRRSGVDVDRVEFHRVPTDRSWIRDSGPIFVVRDGRGRRSRDIALTDWRFTGWSRYPNWKRDNQVPRRLARRLKLRRFEAVAAHGGRRRPVVLEGGSIDVNGAGLLLTTEECLLSPVQARNPGLGRDDVERALADYLGVRTVLWLGRGIAGDDTHGHVDDIARFVDRRTVAAAVERNPRDANHAPLKENLARLRRMRGLDGRPLEVVPIPMPRPIVFEGQRLPASYLNFYVGNRVVLVPTFNDPTDRVALTELARLFPDREVVGIHAVDLILGLGTIHCLTQQEPA
jgi:agmatine deiminase